MMLTKRLPLIIAVLAAVLVAPSGAVAGTQLKNICRIKGQEENTLQGLGLVVGLRGSGDSAAYFPMIRSLAVALDLMGNPLGPAGPLELRETRNVALVMVTATVPAAGARQGDRIDCTVSSIGSAKSLLGGRLFMTPLMGPDVESTRVFGFCQGAVSLDNVLVPTTGRVHGGCRLEEDFFNAFCLDGRMTLVIDEYHADFEVAQEMADLINASLSLQAGGRQIARAINAVNVEVDIPPQYQNDPVLFVSQVMGLTVNELRTGARVVINERAGSVVIGEDVEIGPVVVTHRNTVIETGDNLPLDRFVPIDPANPQNTQLKSLVAALNAVKVPTDDIIEIIKGLDRNGKLHGRLIIE